MLKKINGDPVSSFEIGAIYISVSNENPSKFLGGAWERIAKGKTLIGVDENDSDFGTAEKVGGSKSNDIRALIGAINGAVKTVGYYKMNAVSAYPNYTQYVDVGSSGTGGNLTAIANHSTKVVDANGQDPSTLSPYLTVYFWKRVS